MSVSVLLSTATQTTNDPLESVQTWCREWPWDTLEVYCFGVQRSKVNVTGSITLHCNTSFRTTMIFHSHSLCGDIKLWVHSSFVVVAARLDMYDSLINSHIFPPAVHLPVSLPSECRCGSENSCGRLQSFGSSEAAVFDTPFTFSYVDSMYAQLAIL